MGVAAFLMMCAMAQAVDTSETDFVDFGQETLPEFVQFHNTTGERVAHEDGHALRVQFHLSDWPNIFFKAPEAGWDWSSHAGVAVSLYNPGEESVTAHMRVDNAGADGENHCNNAQAGIPPGQRAILSLRFNTGEDEGLWGMRGVPGKGPRGTGSILDPSKITAFQVFLNMPQQECTLIFERAWLFGSGEEAIALPFVDRLGQYKHADWPGKLKGEEELANRREEEARELAQSPALSGRDRFGGWAEGPALEATGWFRTQQVDGKWWLVTPDGHLFLSNGLDCVGTWQRTFVTGREAWFEWLPDRESGPFKPFYSRQSGAHSGAEPIGGEGWAFGFYAANLFRKYGESWETDWRNTTYARLQSWGFNTIANWSQWDVLEHSPMPYVVSTGVSGVPLVEGGTGYWSKMKDVFAPEFEERADKALQQVAEHHAQNPLCLGYFVDNELAWGGIEKGILESPLEQPCRKELIKDLQEKYGNIEGLNAAWGVEAESWDALRTPPLASTGRDDLEAFLYRFAKRYFEVIQKAREKYAPNQLYLGCRFAGRPPAVVEKACAETIDVVSYNLYYHWIPEEKWVGEDDLGKPVIIGEFHFGALDRGMFHTGLVAAADQNERAQDYVDYVRSVADHPAFVGCHWFQYVDEPNTGRWFDGENYNIGFVDVTDTPYPEMVEAARSVHGEIYRRRYEKK